MMSTADELATQRRELTDRITQFLGGVRAAQLDWFSASLSAHSARWAQGALAAAADRAR